MSQWHITTPDLVLACRLPALLDQDAIICESTSALLYLLEQYGEGRLAPPVTNAAARATFLQARNQLCLQSLSFFDCR